VIAADRALAPVIARNVPLTCSVLHEPGFVVVSVAGEVDAGSEQDFRDGLASAVSDGAQHVVVDLARVDFMASAGLGVLLGVRRVLADGGRRLVLASARGDVAQVLAITGVSAVIPMAASVADAAAALDA
jgi:anti-sigma B factor antagonist